MHSIQTPSVKVSTGSWMSQISQAKSLSFSNATSPHHFSTSA
jgi:hypothetical protein